MRYWIQCNRKLYGKIHALVIAEIHRHYRNKAISIGIKDPKPGSIAFTQRFGSALNLNPHMHVLCPDGVYTRVDGRPRWNNLDSITDQEVAELITRISQSVMRYLRKLGYLDKDGDVVVNPMTDEPFQESESLSLSTTASIAGKIAFGPNAGKYVTKIGSGFGYGEEIPLAKGKLCFSLNSFSLHANTHINTQQRDRLHKLIEYIARGPLSNDRLEITSDGKVKLQLKTRWADGTTHLPRHDGPMAQRTFCSRLRNSSKNSEARDQEGISIPGRAKRGRLQKLFVEQNARPGLQDRCHKVRELRR